LFALVPRAFGGFFWEKIKMYRKYEAEKQAWLRAHPNATPEQIEQAFQAIARRLGI
jgi:hypothetical protein